MNTCCMRAPTMPGSFIQTNVTMNYDLNAETEEHRRTSTYQALRSLWSYIDEGKKDFLTAVPFIIANSLLNLTGSLLIGYAIDRYIRPGARAGMQFPFLLLCVYGVAFFTSHMQNKLAGIAGQKILYRLRN